MLIKFKFLKCYVKIKIKYKKKRMIKSMKNWSLRCLVLFK